MKINEKIYSLRKQHNLSQEELADKLNVSRQTVSKWELGDSCPDFDKIVPLCEVFGITTEELLRDKKIAEKDEKEVVETKSSKKAFLICSAVFLYFMAIGAIVFCEEFLEVSEGISVGIFFMFCGLATALIIYSCMTSPKKVKEKKEHKKNPILMGIISVVSLVFTVVYLLVSFLTGAWHITWLIWLVDAIVIKIIELIFTLKEDSNEK